METVAGWVSSSAKTGLDHLGAQAPCIHIYGRLIPGITNVTDRARYYSFYPWLFAALDRVDEPRTPSQLQDLFRRAECLFTLVAERHARVSGGSDGTRRSDRHGIAMVGRDSLLPALDALESGSHELRLSQYATLESHDERYFKNPWGGLAQYYRGTLEELGILVADSKTGARYTEEIGEPLAGAMEKAVEGDQFVQALLRDVVSVDDLDSFASLCPCRLSESEDEHDSLIETFFDRSENHSEEGRFRRDSLCLLLHLSQTYADRGINLEREQFSVSVYGQALSDGSAWKCPESLRPVRDGWGIYVTNELLSLATQSLFFSVLDAYDRVYRSRYGRLADTTGEIANWFSSTNEAQAALASFEGEDVASVIEKLRESLPALDDVNHEHHELQLLSRCSRLVDDGDIQGLVELGLRVILNLIARSNGGNAPYGKLDVDSEYLRDYPINLQSLHDHYEQNWKSLTPKDLLTWILHSWCLETHMKVALRKLRYDTRSTFRIRPTDLGLEVAEKIPLPARTTPRFRQAMQILHDLNLLERDEDGLSVPTATGLLASRVFVNE